MNGTSEKSDADIASDMEDKLATIRYLAAAVRMMGHVEETAEIDPDALIGLGRALERAAEDAEADRLVLWRLLLNREPRG